MKAMIFAAGLGTRLKPITDKIPKALLPICGKPLLQYAIEKVKSAGFTSIVINIHHFAEQIKEYVELNKSFGVEIEFSDESDLLRETGGGIKHAGKLLNVGEPFFVYNVDILSNLDIKAFVDVHIASSANSSLKSTTNSEVLATLLVSERETQRYLLFNSDNNLVGWMNTKTGEIRSPYRLLRRDADEGAVFGLGKGPEQFNAVEYFDYETFLKKYNLKKYAFDGSHVISSRVFELMQDMPQKFSIIDFYLKNCDKYSIKFHIQDDLKMIDVGKMDSLQKAEEFVVQS